MKTSEMGGQSPDTEKPLEEKEKKISRAETILLRQKAIKRKISDIEEEKTRLYGEFTGDPEDEIETALMRQEIIDLQEENQRLAVEWSEIAKDVARGIPKVWCKSVEDYEFDYGIPAGEYFVMGLPKGVDQKKVSMETGPQLRLDLLIDGEKFRGPWRCANSEGEILDGILHRRMRKRIEEEKKRKRD